MLRQFVSPMLFASLLWVCASAVLAADAPPVAMPEDLPETSIPFARQGGINNWVVEDESTLLLQDRHGLWYRARLLVPAYYLPYASSLGFATGPSGTLERLDSVVLDGKKYPIISLTKADPPPVKKKK